MIKINSKDTEQRYWRRYAVFVNFEHISHHFLVIIVLTLSK